MANRPSEEVLRNVITVCRNSDHACPVHAKWAAHSRCIRDSQRRGEDREHPV